MNNQSLIISEFGSLIWFALIVAAILIPILIMSVIEILAESKKGGDESDIEP